MSRKSDNDNHSNQLNPNNAEYWNCRAGGDGDRSDDADADEPRWKQHGRSGLARGFNFEGIERTRFYFAAVAFDGTAVYVRFETEVTINVFAGQGAARAREFSSAARDVLLGHLGKRCALGAAYWRLATDESRGQFFWYTPPLSEKQLNTMAHIYGERESKKMLAWHRGVRNQSQQFDLLFDWGKHEAAVDLGVIASEAITFAPETEDLRRWNKQGNR